MEYKVTHDKQNHRFETQVDGHTGYVEYVPQGDGIAITHTIVPMKIEGRGVAAALVKETYDYARAQGLRVVPICSYALTWSRRHPDYDDVK